MTNLYQSLSSHNTTNDLFNKTTNLILQKYVIKFSKPDQK